MKTRTGKINGLAALVALMGWCARAYDNPCIEQIQTNDLNCVYQGGVAPGYVLAPSSLTVAVGQPIPLPGISGLVLTNGLETYTLTNPCTPEGNGLYSSPIVYNNGVLNFAPPIPPVLWTPGSCTYTALVVAAGSPCQPLTNQVGVVTITVSGNQPDVLIDVDFGGAVPGSKLGYAAIGDSPTDQWNYYVPGGNVVVGALGNLVTAEGWVSPVGLVVTNLASAGVNSSPDPMYNDYLYTNAASATVSLTNVPTGTWTVYLYARDGSFNLRVGSTDYGMRTNYDQPLSGVLWQSGVQYSVFTNVAVSDGLPVTITVSSGRGGAAMLSGLQLVSTGHNFPPAITAQPVDVNTNLGANATFSVGATGSPLSYQWLKNGAALSEGARLLGTHAGTLTVSNVSLQDAGLYSVVVSNADGTVASHYAALRIWNPSLELAWGYMGDTQTNVPAGLTNVVATVSGGIHALALKGDGSVVAWGANNLGQTNVPAGLTNVVAIAAGWHHSLALKNDGTVVAWGFNGYTQTNVPAGLTNVVAIAAGDNHCLALKADGSITAWGRDDCGQINVPVGLTNVVALAGGALHSLALKPDGTVVAWGDNSYGECNVPPDLSNVVGIATEWFHNLALKDDGTVVTWGWNDYGQCNVPSDLSNVVAIAAGHYHNLALKNDGTVKGWGTFISPPGLSNVVAVAAGTYVSLALVDMGLSPTNGNNVQLAYFPFDDTNTWAGAAGQLPLVTNNVVGVSSWSTNALTVDSANPAVLIYRGVESNGATNLVCSQGTVSLWVKPNWSSPLAGGSGPQNEGRLLEVGSAGPTNDWWALGVNAAGSSLYFATQTNSSATRTTNLTATLNWTSNTWHQVVLSYSSSSSCLYLDGVPVVTNGAGVTAYPRLSVLNQGIAVGSSAAGTNQVHGVLDELATYNCVLSAATIASNYQAAVVLDSDSDGLPNMIENQLGLDPYTYNSGLPRGITAQPVDVNTNPGASATFSVGVTGGTSSYQWLKNGAALSDGARILGTHASVLRVNNVSLQDAGLYSVVVSNAAGTVVSHYAALRILDPSLVLAWGDDTYGQTNVPAGLTNVVAIAAGIYHSLALKNDGTVVAWGYASQTDVPPGLTNVVAVAVGTSHSLALKNDGTVVAWGANGFHQTDVPAGLTNVVAIAAGHAHNLALKNDGTVVPWGWNDYGQCDVPEGLTNVVAVAAGIYHSLALKADGTPMSWGWIDDVPPGLTNVVAVAAGGFHNLALKGDGTVVDWDWIDDVPPGLTNVVAIAAGYDHSLALKNDGTITGWGVNSCGETTPPPGVSNVVGIAAGFSASVALKMPDSDNDGVLDYMDAAPNDPTIGILTITIETPVNGAVMH